jgi:hypothetical protein
MDTYKTPLQRIKNVAPEVLKAAGAVSAAGSDAFLYGGYPKTAQLIVIKSKTLRYPALEKARAKWLLALQFDHAMEWLPLSPQYDAQLTHVLGGDAMRRQAENAWIDAVRLWPDRTTLESRAYFFASLKADGTADDSIINAELRIAELQAVIREKMEESRKHSDSVEESMKMTINGLKTPAIKRLTAQLKNLQQRSEPDTLHPERWIAHVRRLQRYRPMKPQAARVLLGKIIPSQLGATKESNAFAIGVVYVTSYRWLKEFPRKRRELEKCGILKKPMSERKKFGTPELELPSVSISDAACILTSHAMNYAFVKHFPNAFRISYRQVQRIVGSQKSIRYHEKFAEFIKRLEETAQKVQ